MSFHRFLLISGLAAACALAAFADDPVKSAATTATISRNSVFAPVTLAPTETARVIVINTATVPTSTSTTSSSGATNDVAPSCTGKITFMASGATPPSTAAVSFTVGSGQFATADLPYAKSGLSTTPGEVIGQVESDLTLPSTAPCSLGMSLVVFDTTTGVAHVVLTGASVQGGSGPIPSVSGLR